MPCPRACSAPFLILGLFILAGIFSLLPHAETTRRCQGRRGEARRATASQAPRVARRPLAWRQPRYQRCACRNCCSAAPPRAAAVAARLASCGAREPTAAFAKSSCAPSLRRRARRAQQLRRPPGACLAAPMTAALGCCGSGRARPHYGAAAARPCLAETPQPLSHLLGHSLASCAGCHRRRAAACGWRRLPPLCRS